MAVICSGNRLHHGKNEELPNVKSRGAHDYHCLKGV